MKYSAVLFLNIIILLIIIPLATFAQIPMKKVLSRVSIPSEGNLRGLVDTVGFPHRASQMDLIAKLALKAEREKIKQNLKKFKLSSDNKFIFGICPHDDYTLASRTSVHIQKFIKAKTVILIGNAHWSETFDVRNKLIFGDFKYWRGPYGKVKISPYREKILTLLPKKDYIVNRTIVETEHSLEALVPFLQYFNREVEIVPILIPFTDWKEENRLGEDLTQTVAKIVNEKHLKLGKDLAILCSSDGMHYGDYGWSYYNYHPFGCNPNGYKEAMAYDSSLVTNHLTNKITIAKLHKLFDKIIDENNISNYKVTWCGRFSITLAANFAERLARKILKRNLTGYFLRHSSSIQEAWIPVRKIDMGITGDTNLHHFVTYFSVGFK